MEFRSTADAYVHHQGDIVSNVNSSHGVHLTGGSTGGIVQPASDDANVSLRVRGKGTGGVIVGDSSQSVTIAGSTSGFKGFFNSTFTAQFAAISSGQVSEVALSTAIGTFAPGDLVSVTAIVTPAVAVMAGFRLDSDVSTRLTMLIANPGSTATSTGRVVGTVTWADLT